MECLCGCPVLRRGAHRGRQRASYSDAVTVCAPRFRRRVGNRLRRGSVFRVFVRPPPIPAGRRRGYCRSTDAGMDGAPAQMADSVVGMDRAAPAGEGHGRGTRPATTARIVPSHVRGTALFGALREVLQAGCLRYVMVSPTTKAMSHPRGCDLGCVPVPAGRRTLAGIARIPTAGLVPRPCPTLAAVR